MTDQSQKVEFYIEIKNFEFKNKISWGKGDDLCANPRNKNFLNIPVLHQSEHRLYSLSLHLQ